jgi:hypothetical protein
MWLFINDELIELLLLSNIITIAGHACANLSSQTFQHQPGSGTDHHTGSMLAIFRQFFGVSHHGSNGLQLVILLSDIPLWVHHLKA